MPGYRRLSPAERRPRAHRRAASERSSRTALATGGDSIRARGGRRQDALHEPAQASETLLRLCEPMFDNSHIHHLGALLSELCAAALELATLGEVRLPLPRAHQSEEEARCPMTAARRRRRDAGPTAASWRSVPSSTRLWTDRRVIRRLAAMSAAADALPCTPGGLAGLEARATSRRRGACHARRRRGRVRSGARPLARPSAPPCSRRAGVAFYNRQSSRSTLQPCSPRSRTTRTSPSGDLAITCARSSWTPGRSSTRTSSRAL